ncbi:MAG: hypothetical protein RQ758_01285 [Methanomicrobiaceae archaeon]|nr:hypothetical protein [Methanomicrobiaceae archaeon]
MGILTGNEVVAYEILMRLSGPRRDTELLDTGHAEFWCPYEEEWLLYCAEGCEKGWFCPLYLPDEQN